MVDSANDLPRVVLEHPADPPLRAAVAVQRGDVEVADPDVPGVAGDLHRCLVRDRPGEPADACAPETEAGDPHLRASEGDRLERVDCHRLRVLPTAS